MPSGITPTAGGGSSPRSWMVFRIQVTCSRGWHQNVLSTGRGMLLGFLRSPACCPDVCPPHLPLSVATGQGHFESSHGRGVTGVSPNAVSACGCKAIVPGHACTTSPCHRHPPPGCAGSCKCVHGIGPGVKACDIDRSALARTAWLRWLAGEPLQQFEQLLIGTSPDSARPHTTPCGSQPLTCGCAPPSGPLPPPAPAGWPTGP